MSKRDIKHFIDYILVYTMLECSWREDDYGFKRGWREASITISQKGLTLIWPLVNVKSVDMTTVTWLLWPQVRLTCTTLSKGGFWFCQSASVPYIELSYKGVVEHESMTSHGRGGQLKALKKCLTCRLGEAWGHLWVTSCMEITHYSHYQ